MITDSDIAVAIVVALVVLIVILGVWPGLLRVRAGDLAGYWAGSDGKLYAIRPTGDRSFDLTTSGDSTRPTAGHIVGLRSVKIDGPDSGAVDLGGRRINWPDGKVWTLQGVH
jgi:hypothetical protein